MPSMYDPTIGMQSSPEETSGGASYRTLVVPAVLCTAISAFSILTVLHWGFWLIPLMALALGWHAKKCIDISPEEYTGKWFARGGMIVAVVLAVTGSIIHHHLYKNSIPSGYRPITFDELQSNNPNEIVPASAYDLQPTDRDKTKRVFIKGYINPGKQTVRLKQFILVPTVSHCSTCPPAQTKSTEMILVTFTDDLMTDYTSGEVYVGGKLTIDPVEALNPYGGFPYQIEADYFDY